MFPSVSHCLLSGKRSRFSLLGVSSHKVTRLIGNVALVTVLASMPLHVSAEPSEVDDGQGLATYIYEAVPKKRGGKVSAEIEVVYSGTNLHYKSTSSLTAEKEDIRIAVTSQGKLTSAIRLLSDRSQKQLSHQKVLVHSDTVGMRTTRETAKLSSRSICRGTENWR